MLPLDWNPSGNNLEANMAINYEGFRAAAVKQYPQQAKQIDEFIKRKQTEELARQGVVGIEDIAKTDPGAALRLSQQGIKPASKLSAEEQKKADAFNATAQLVDTLERRFSEARGGEYTGMGAIIGGTKKNIAGAIGLDDPARIYNAERTGFGAVLKTLTGDVGVLTDKDYARLSKLLPSFTDSADVAQSKFEDVRKQMAAKFGGQDKISKYVRPEVRGGLGAAVFPETSEAIKQDVGQIQQAQQQLYGGGSYGDYLKSILGVGVREALPTGRNLGVAGELLPIAGAAATLAGGGIKNILSPRKALSQARSTAAKETTQKISTDTIKRAGEKYLASDPEAASIANKVLPSLKKKLSAIDLSDRIKVWNDAYTASGRVGNSAKAGFYDALARAAKGELAQKAPEVAKYTNLLRLSYQVPKKINQGAMTALKISGLGRLLGL